MTLRTFNRRFFALLTVFALGIPGATVAQNAIDPEGKYELVDPPQPTEAAAGKVEIVEVFWYGCPHCYNFLCRCIVRSRG